MLNSSMSLRTNSFAISATRYLNGNNQSLSKNLTAIASGLKITNASLDSSGLAISQKMRVQIKLLEQSSLNSQDGISLVQTADGAMKEIHDILGRMLEISLKSMNGTLSEEIDRDSLDKEFSFLRYEVDRISEGIEFNGVKLLNGSIAADTPDKKAVNIQIGENGSFDSVTIAVSDMRAKSLGLNRLSVKSIEEARRSAGSLKNIVNIVSQDRSSLGAIENRLEYASDSLNSSIEATTSAHSRIVDADIAKKMMEYTRDSILTASSQAMLAHAVLKPQAILDFISGSSPSPASTDKASEKPAPPKSTASTKDEPPSRSSENQKFKDVAVY